MRLLSRHVSSVVAGAILIVLLVVVSVDVLAAVIDEVGDMRVAYTFIEVLKYVGTTLPGRVYENIPLSALIGCLVGLGMLAGNSELVVMRAAGVSLLRIVAFVMKPVLAFIIIGVLLGEYAVPFTDQLAEGRRMLLRGEQDDIASASGLWNREGNEYIHINAVLPNGKLFGVSRYRFDDRGGIARASFSKEVHYLGDHWLEEEGRVTRFRGGRAETGTFVTRRWDSELSPDLLRLVSMPANSLSMANLYRYANYLQEQDQDAGQHWLSFWSKALQPLTTGGLVLVAISFIFGPLRQSTTGFRIFTGVIIGIAFNTSQQFLGPASLVYGFEPFWAVLAPVVVCVGVGLLLLRRAA